MDWYSHNGLKASHRWSATLVNLNTQLYKIRDKGKIVSAGCWGGGDGGRNDQALYAHMNNKMKKKIHSYTYSTLKAI
jgi:hypothetical protein